MDRIERGMVSITMISLFNKELIGVYLDRESGDLWRVCISVLCVCEVGEVGEVGGGSLFLQRARRLVKGLYFSTDVPILWFG